MNEQEVAQWLEGALADLCLRVQVKAQPLQDSPGDYALASCSIALPIPLPTMSS